MPRPYYRAFVVHLLVRGSDSITGMKKPECSKQCGCAAQSYQGNLGTTESTPRISNHRYIVKFLTLIHLNFVILIACLLRERVALQYK